jgi:hypothetical protein
MHNILHHVFYYILILCLHLHYSIRDTLTTLCLDGQEEA